MTHDASARQATHARSTMTIGCRNVRYSKASAAATSTTSHRRHNRVLRTAPPAMKTPTSINVQATTRAWLARRPRSRPSVSACKPSIMRRSMTKCMEKKITRSKPRSSADLAGVVRPRTISRVVDVDRLEHERPAPFDPRRCREARPERGKRQRTARNERPQRRESDAAGLVARIHPEPIVDLPALPIRPEHIGRRHLRADEILEQVEAVEAAAVLSQPREPRPDALTRRRDRDGARGLRTGASTISSPGSAHSVSSTVAPQLRYQGSNRALYVATSIATASPSPSRRDGQRRANDVQLGVHTRPLAKAHDSCHASSLRARVSGPWVRARQRSAPFSASRLRNSSQSAPIQRLRG